MYTVIFFIILFYLLILKKKKKSDVGNGKSTQTIGCLSSSVKFG